MSNVNSFYQDLYRILWKIPKNFRKSAFPQAPPPLFADVLDGRPLNRVWYQEYLFSILTDLALKIMEMVPILLILVKWA